MMRRGCATLCLFFAALLAAQRAVAQVRVETSPLDSKRETVPLEGPIDPVFRAISQPWWATGGDLAGGARLFSMDSLRGPAASTRTQAGGYSLLTRGFLTCARLPPTRNDGTSVLKSFGNGTKALLLAGFIPALEVPLPIPFSPPGKLFLSPIGMGLGIPIGFDPLQFASSRAIHEQAIEIPWARKKRLDRSGGCDRPRDAEERTDPIVRLDEALRSGGVSGRTSR
jgi:hypothetical protein